MPVQLQPQTQELVDTVLYAKENAKRNEALQKIAALPDKDQVEIYILEQLDAAYYYTDRWLRTWLFSVLAEIGSPKGIKKVLDHMFDPPESYAWARHFALINAANFEPFPWEQIERATKDPDVLPKATAFRLLLANGQDKYADELLKMLWDVNPPDSTWAAARALRNRTDMKMKALRIHIEVQFIEPLVRIASDPYSYLDTRWEAIQALSSFIHRKGEVASRLGELLISDDNSTIRRFYLEALLKLNQSNESLNALLKAVEDSDAQIRLDAADALKNMIGAEKSVKLILPLVMEREKNIPLLVDALGRIEPEFAAREIRKELRNSDKKVSSRANQILSMLSGHLAQFFRSQRAQALDKYPDILIELEKIEDNADNLRQLLEQLKTPIGVIPFVGAGLSIPFGFPSWGSFLVTQAEKAGMDERINTLLKSGEYEDAAEELLKGRGYRAFHDAISNTFGTHKLATIKLKGAISFLPQLATGPVITTNFDHVLEEVFKEADIPFEREVWGANAEMATKALIQHRKFLLKIHGDAEDSTNRILTKSDYSKHYGSSDGSTIDFSLPLPGLLRQMLSGRPLLFLGCSLNQDRTIAVLKEVSTNSPFIAHYAIVEQPASKKLFHERSRFLSDHTIRPIWFPSGKYDFIEPLLAYILEQTTIFRRLFGMI